MSYPWHSLEINKKCPYCSLDFAHHAAGISCVNALRSRLLALEGRTTSCALCEEKARRIEILEKNARWCMAELESFFPKPHLVGGSTDNLGVAIWRKLEAALSALDERGDGDNVNKENS